MALTQEQIQEHLQKIRNEEHNWEESRAILLAAGREVVPELMKLVEQERNILSRQFIPNRKPLQRLAELLTEFHDPQSLMILYDCIVPLFNEVKVSFFHQLVPVLQQRAETEDLSALIAFLAKTNSTYVANVLVQIAEQEPRQELREVLPLLKAGFSKPSAPLEFIGLRGRLKAALASESLPLPSKAAMSTDDNLPIPIKEPTE
ncbi:hypothetical protein [Armatimonas rosea]|uniref:tRNA nucleotidyltransferase/poly(A) polymerase n=1 Tax=Armatimonas rosea TaxID=685828 RepID=A0A7W9SQT8_ARMRO|nr:hypothetical protein [Armatimonas rosea]MBB6050514.1 tRNA nucleotidyltransferase/poly(A) polymerase [Armatimonas rosea]